MCSNSFDVHESILHVRITWGSLDTKLRILSKNENFFLSAVDIYYRPSIIGWILIVEFFFLIETYRRRL